jgi:acetylornithine deacetylase/succinyl-diaminopimelate desuccinylase-like protein
VGLPDGHVQPGNSDLDHAPSEWIDLAECDRSIPILEAVCETLRE